MNRHILIITAGAIAHIVILALVLWLVFGMSPTRANPYDFNGDNLQDMTDVTLLTRYLFQFPVPELCEGIPGLEKESTCRAVKGRIGRGTPLVGCRQTHRVNSKLKCSWD